MGTFNPLRGGALIAAVAAQHGDAADAARFDACRAVDLAQRPPLTAARRSI